MTDPFVASARLKQLSVDALLHLSDLQTIGATDDASLFPMVANLIVENERVQHYAQTNTPLFLPLEKLDPSLSAANRAASGTTDNQAVTKQISDNGLIAQFMAIFRVLDNKLTDQRWLCGTRIRYGVTAPSTGAATLLLSEAGVFPHSIGPNQTGVPVDSSVEATYVELIDQSTNMPFVVLSGVNAGQRVWGRTQVGASTSPDSVEVALLSRPIGASPSVQNPYTWESGQPSTLNVVYGFRQALNELDDTALRRVFR